MKKTLSLFFITALTVFSADKKDVDERLTESAAVFQEIMSSPDKGIPQDLLKNANCVVIIPGMKKGAFIVGAKYGKGFTTCRKEKGAGWSAPAAIRIEGGSVGFQIGGQETDVVLLVMNERGFERLMSTKFTLGGEGSVAAGPVGRESTAQTDAGMKAEILSYSRARGVFAGISLTGATLRPDEDDNAAMYGSRLTTKQIVDTHVKATPAAGKLLSELSRYSMTEKK